MGGSFAGTSGSWALGTAALSQCKAKVKPCQGQGASKSLYPASFPRASHRKNKHEKYPEKLQVKCQQLHAFVLCVDPGYVKQNCGFLAEKNTNKAGYFSCGSGPGGTMLRLPLVKGDWPSSSDSMPLRGATVVIWGGLLTCDGASELRSGYHHSMMIISNDMIFPYFETLSKPSLHFPPNHPNLFDLPSAAQSHEAPVS